MPTMICQKCGKECERTSNVQKYCPECRKKKQVERNATYQQKRENTPDLVVAVGSQAICPNCKKSFLKNREIKFFAKIVLRNISNSRRSKKGLRCQT